MLPHFSEKRARYEAEFERIELHALLCKHEEEQASKGWGFLGEEGYQRCLQGKIRVCRLEKSMDASQLDITRLIEMEQQCTGHTQDTSGAYRETPSGPPPLRALHPPDPRYHPTLERSVYGGGVSTYL